MTPAPTYWISVPGSADPPLGPLGVDEITTGVRAGQIPKTATACEIGKSTWEPVTRIMAPAQAPPTPPRTKPSWILAIPGILALVAGLAIVPLLLQVRGRVSDLEARLANATASATPLTSTAASEPVATNRIGCSRAKVACVDAWQQVLPGAEAARKAAGTHQSGPGRHPWNQPGLYDRPKAAHEACSTKGAIKIRDAGRAVDAAPERPEVELAKQASEAAFEACRDLEP